MSAQIVLTTVAKKTQAHKLAKILLQKRLAACVSIQGPIQSIYHWKGKLEKSLEYQLLIKTKPSHYARLEKVLKKNHPYDVPEILAIPCTKGSSDYLKWLNTELR